jgi:hypothetical protein
MPHKFLSQPADHMHLFTVFPDHLLAPTVLHMATLIRRPVFSDTCHVEQLRDEFGSLLIADTFCMTDSHILLEHGLLGLIILPFTDLLFFLEGLFELL